MTFYIENNAFDVFFKERFFIKYVPLKVHIFTKYRLSKKLYTPNINQLSNDIESNRSNTLRYLDYMQRAKLINTFLSPQKGMGQLTKPEKIYLDNTNLLYALSNSTVNDGNVRETFFANQLSVNQEVNTSKQGDFQIDKRWVFEIGGAKKPFNQIKDLKDSFVVVDNLEIGFGNRIPLWLFGFIY